jgi:hypothetical protein
MRRVIGDAMVSAGTLGLLLLALMSVDARLRERVAQIVTSPSSADLTGAGAQVREVATVMLSAARDQSIEHAPLMIFTVAAVVLVLFMVRT